MTQNHSDIRTRFIFDDMPIRGMHIRLEKVWQHIVNQKHYPVAIRRALGELLAAGSLLSANLKNEGTLIVQVQGQGRLKMLVVEATSENTVRATARWDGTAEIRDDESLTALLGENSVFVLTHQTGLDAHHALYRLYHETPPRVFEPEAIEFACTCSRGKVSDMLLMLGGQEVGGVVAEQGSIQIDCDFCHSKYVFDETDVNALFGADVVNAVRQENERLQ